VSGVSPALSMTQDVGWGWGSQTLQYVSKKNNLAWEVGKEKTKSLLIFVGMEWFLTCGGETVSLAIPIWSGVLSFGFTAI